MIASILNSGKSYAKACGIKSPLMYSWHESEYLGGAHGLAGILYLLLQVIYLLIITRLFLNLFNLKF